ncbi:hypothetical protein D3C80_1716970 [compost metagenome]
MHGAALALGVTSTAAGKLGHNATRFHAGCQHVTMVTIGSDDLITFLERTLHTNDDSFLTDIKVTEATNKAHTVKLSGLFFETADQQHFTVSVQFLLFSEISWRWSLGNIPKRRLRFSSRRLISLRCHISLPTACTQNRDRF